MFASEIEQHAGPWSEADYLALPADNRRIELLDGGLLISPLASGLHRQLSSRLWLALEQARPEGMAVLQAVNVRLAASRILIPDLVIVRRGGADFTVLEPADVAMAVEIAGPGGVTGGPAIKPWLYAEAGIPYYARVEFAVPRVVLGRLVSDRYEFGEADSTLRMREPFRVDVDLVALMAADRARASTGDLRRSADAFRDLTDPSVTGRAWE